MYYQIEGRINMKTITFDEDGVTVGKDSYPIDEIEELMEKAPDERTRKKFERFLSEMK